MKIGDKIIVTKCLSQEYFSVGDVAVLNYISAGIWWAEFERQGALECWCVGRNEPGGNYQFATYTGP